MLVKKMILVILLAAWSVANVGCGSGPSEEQAKGGLIKMECPPRTGENDQIASTLTQSDTLSHSISQNESVQYSGFLTLNGRTPIPAQSSINVSGGVFVSKVGIVEKKARFGSWDYIYTDSSCSTVVGYGPCLTEGDVIVSALCESHPPRDRFVENSFEAVDFGQSLTLIHLDAAKGHRLCLMLGSSYFDDGRRWFGTATKAIHSAQIYGRCDQTEGEYVNVLTAHYAGARVLLHGVSLERRIDGWYGKR